MSGGRARSRRFAIGLVVTGLSLALCLVLVVAGLDPRPEPTVGADGYSSSGLGHSALLALLAAHGVPVTQSRWASEERAGTERALVIAEPEPGLEAAGGRPDLGSVLAEAKRVLVVAPKRKALGPAPERPRWMADQVVLPPEEANEAFQALGLRLVRPKAGPEDAAFEVPEGWPTPRPAEPLQLFARSSRLEGLVHNEAGVLLGRYKPHGGSDLVLLLADPDVLANHSLVEGENAAFALHLIEHLRDGRPVVWDETWHGHLAQPHLGRLLVEPPLGYVTASLGLLSLLALWAGAVRFGGARPAPPAVAPGKAFLVSNTADLLRAGGHTGHVLRHYAEATEREAAEVLHAGRVDARSARAALETLAAARGLPGPGALAAEVEGLLARRRPEARQLVAQGERIHRWKEDMLHGRRRDP